MGVKKRNRLKKLRQVEVDVKARKPNLAGVAFLLSEIIATFQILTKIPFQTMDNNGVKNRIGSKNSCKPNLMGVTTPVLEILFVFLFAKTNFPMGSKNRIGSKNSCK